MPDWARAHGEPLFDGIIRQRTKDFVVRELLGFEPSGDGEHDLLLVRKTSANTAWVARRLAAFAGIPSRDVGYCGLKDRHAVATQWFSVRRVGVLDWTGFDAEGVEILDVHAHRRKLRRGAHRGNAFRIVLRPIDNLPSSHLIDERLRVIRGRGVPNYFGEQRFGHDGANIELAQRLFDGERMKRDRRSIAISAARSFLFNTILDSRVRGDSWDRVIDGDLVNLDGSGSIFPEAGDDLSERLASLDVHPAGSLWGTGAPQCADRAAEVEEAAVRDHTRLSDGLIGMHITAGNRALRTRVGELEWVIHDDAVGLRFELGRGAFATSVLREIATVVDAQTASSNT